MAREGLTLAEAATRLGQPIGKLEAANLFRSKGFQRLLRAERLRYYAEIGRDPEWSKRTAVGQLLSCVQGLMEEGAFDKAAEVILKAAKLEGWIGTDTTVTVFNQLSSKDFQELRARVQREADLEAHGQSN
jgi:hypothetical protein